MPTGKKVRKAKRKTASAELRTLKGQLIKLKEENTRLSLQNAVLQVLVETAANNGFLEPSSNLQKKALS